MASSSRRHPHRGFTSATPHFFKVILPHILTQRKLNVPKKFVSRHGEALQNEEVFLKVANGAEWKVGVEKSNGKVWFEKGWQQFVEFYSIGVGYFLTFRYETNACFHVTIFDPSASEIEYPMEDFGDIRSESEEFEDQILVYKRRREGKITQTNLYSVAHHKKMKISNDHDEVLRNEDFQSSKFKDRLKVIKCENGLRSVTERASTFQSMTPNHSFMITMGPSYIHTGKGDPNIPKSFAKIHVKKSQEISLEDSDGRVWKIWCGVRPSQNVNKSVEMRGGWKAFARDNSLEEGHICVFELMKGTKLSFKVTIFR
ncbi:B3 domain-containing protein At4g01580-like [Momordica charantia]|uniref:B3 domain-containing protein At4g01580-like n=1 Tax=Momordica charantia TaxID=3673 RepID=A0A6J1E0D8_MOMCH|nr:B3 domain-containing protein At4g01580-like [Momordica charantia]